MRILPLLQSVLIWGVVLTPIVPLFVIPSIYTPFVGAQAFIFRILVELLIAVWAILALHSTHYRPRISLLMGVFAAFVGVVAIADSVGLAPQVSMWGTFERMEGLIALVHWLLYSLLLGTVLSSAGWKNFFRSTVVISSLIAFLALAEWTGIISFGSSIDRIGATLGNASFLGTYLMLHVFLAGILATYSAFRPYWLWGCIGLLHLLAIYATGSRGALLALVVGMMVAGAIYALKASSKVRKALLIGGVSTVVLMGAFAGIIAAQNENTVVARFIALGGEPLATQPRVLIWNMAFRGAIERPLLGYGQENFTYVFSAKYDPRLSLQEPWFDRAHNAFLDWLVAGGVAALLLYTALFVMLCWYVWHGKGIVYSQRAMLGGLLSAYLVQHLVVFETYASFFVLSSIIAYLHTQRIGVSQIPVKNFIKASPWAYGGIGVFLVLWGTLVYVITVQPLQASRALAHALVEPSLEEQVVHFEKALEYSKHAPFDVRAVREQFAQAVGDIVGHTEGADEHRGTLVARAQQELLMSLSDEPESVRLHARMAQLFADAGDYEAAKEFLLRATTLSPHKKDLKFNLGQVYLHAGETDIAVQYFRELYELETSFVDTSAYQYYIDQARIYYVAALIHAGREEEAEELLIARYNTIVIPKDPIINAYSAQRAYQKLSELWYQRTLDEPTDPQNHVSLAAVYVALGEYGMASVALRYAVALDPAYAQQAEYLLQEIQRQAP